MNRPPLFPARRLMPAGALLLASSLAFGASTVAQEDDAIDPADVLTARAYPVTIQAGSCGNLATEPNYALGLMPPRVLIALDQEDEDAELLNEDVDNDAVLDPEEDLDDDGVIDFGFDLDDDGVLDLEEILDAPIVWSFLGDLGDATLIETGVEDDFEDDPELDDLREEPHAIVIHRTEATDTDYLACGEITGVAIDGTVVVVLRPITPNGLVGFAQLEEGDDGFLGIGDDPGAVEINAWPAQATDLD